MAQSEQVCNFGGYPIEVLGTLYCTSSKGTDHTRIVWSDGVNIDTIEAEVSLLLSPFTVL